jgi:transcriptional regulator with XRE-family HTH domain
MPGMNTPGERIAALRKQAQMTQRQLAEAAGVTPLSVRNWEKGTNRPRSDHLAGLAKALRTTSGYLNGETDESRPVRAAHEAAVAPRTYDPDEPPVPPGLQRLIDMGLPIRADELRRLRAYADPLNPTRGARGAAGWSPGEWLDVLVEERRNLAAEE